METSEAAVDIRALNEKIEKESAFIDLLMMEINKSIVGQKTMMERLLIALLGNGHILLEGVPGLAKTLAIKSLAQAIDANFSPKPWNNTIKAKGPIRKFTSMDCMLLHEIGNTVCQ